MLFVHRLMMPASGLATGNQDKVLATNPRWSNKWAELSCLLKTTGTTVHDEACLMNYVHALDDKYTG